MMKTLKRIEPLQLGKIAGAFYGLISLIFVPFILLFAVIGGLAAHAQNGPAVPFTIGAGVMMALFMPVLYAGMGFIFGIIGACLYNFLASRLGGIQVDVE
jgi:hypothetical protein